MGGNVELTVPEGLSMDVDIELAYTRRHEGRYAIHSDFDLKLEESDNWDNRDGEPRRYLYGTGSIGGGTHRVSIKTTNGDIYLHRGS
jgi:hypothetical protein